MEADSAAHGRRKLARHKAHRIDPWVTDEELAMHGALILQTVLQKCGSLRIPGSVVVSMTARSAVSAFEGCTDEKIESVIRHRKGFAPPVSGGMSDRPGFCHVRVLRWRAALGHGRSSLIGGLGTRREGPERENPTPRRRLFLA